MRMKVGLHNRFDVFKKNVNTGEETQIAFAENMILNALWNTINTVNYHWGNSISIGTGTGTLSVSRTSLFNQLANISPNTNVYTYIPELRAWSRRMSITLTEAQYVGSFITEIGMVRYNSNVDITTHALFKDMYGNPIAIEKTDVDIITIFATVYAVFDTEYFGDNDCHLLTNPRIRNSLINTCLGTQNFAAGIFYYNNTEDALATWAMSGLSPIFRAATANVTLSWNASLRKLTLTATRLAAGSGNVAAGIWSAFWAEGFIVYNFIKSPVWDGQYIENDPLGNGDGIATNFRTKYPIDNAEPPIIKVDGVVELGVTITPNTLFDKKLNRQLKIIEFTNLSSLPGYGGSTGISSSSSTATYCIAENPLYETYGITHVFTYRMSIKVSNDLINWVEAIAYSTSSSIKAVPELYQNYRYWYAEDPGQDGSWSIQDTTLIPDSALINVVFNTPPGLVEGEAVGIGNNSEVNFTLDHIPASGLVVKLNDVTTEDYTIVDALITFATAPGTGVVITADYIYTCTITADYLTRVVAKDSNHVFDFVGEIYFDEYVPE